MEQIYRYVDENSQRFISELFTLLKQPSISSQGIGVQECARLLASMMEDVGIHCEILPMGGKNNPPLVYGQIVSPKAKRTVLIYGHFDVQPPEPLEEWDSPPFEPTIHNGRIYGRGSADDKGQLFAHIKAVEAIMKVAKEMPINLKFLCDPEEEIGSPSLDAFVRANKERFSADYAYESDSPIDASGRPKLVFGQRGICYVEVNHREANRDLHSGQFGGPVPNPNKRMIRFLNTLWDADGRIAIEGFYDDVVPPSPAEKEALAQIPFDEAKTLDYLGLKHFEGPTDIGYWQKIMFQPTLDVNGYSSGYGGPGSKTIIPCRVMVKISMRLVKNQDPMDIFDKFKRHMEKHGCGDFEIKLFTTYSPTKTPIDHPISEAVIRAVKKVFQSDPVIFPVTGGSAPTGIITEFLGIPLFKVPYAGPDERNHAPNENMDIDLFIKGIKTSATVFYELSKT